MNEKQREREGEKTKERKTGEVKDKDTEMSLKTILKTKKERKTK